jgi:hypothetical protein
MEHITIPLISLQLYLKVNKKHYYIYKYIEPLSIINPTLMNPNSSGERSCIKSLPVLIDQSGFSPSNPVRGRWFAMLWAS